MKFDDYEERGFAQKYGFVIGIGVVAGVVAVLVIGQVSKSPKEAPVRMPEVVMVRPLPPPPPPPPPPPRQIEPPKETAEKMLAQTPVDAPETKPDNTPKAGPSGPTTNLTGPGSDAFGLGRGGGGGGYGGTGGGGGSRFGWFAGEVQRTIQEALGRNPTTRDASFSETVRVWADASGRVVRVRLVGSTGDLALDRALDEALSGVQLQDAPPSDMPMPIVMRLEARRPE